MALILGLKEWIKYLVGAREIVVLTDSRNITYLLQLKRMPPKYVRWVCVFAIFKLRFKHIAGKDNVLADALSRAFADEGFALPLSNKSSDNFPAVDVPASQIVE